MVQTRLKVFKGIKVPFTESETKLVHEQFLRATLSANLPFQWTENPEIIKLFLMFRATAGGIIPSAKRLSTSLLSQENGRVVEEIKAVIKDQDVVIAYVILGTQLLHVLKTC